MSSVTIKFLLLFAICLNIKHASSQTTSETTMHRLQDTTRISSGWYFGLSTEGHFSVELPIPFNDFTLKVKDLKVYVIGSTSSEGIKFSVTEMRSGKKFRKVDTNDAIIKTGGQVAEIVKMESRRWKTVKYKLTGEEHSAYYMISYTKRKVFTMIIEYPVAAEELVNQLESHFFSSFEMDKRKLGRR